MSAIGSFVRIIGAPVALAHGVKNAPRKFRAEVSRNLDGARRAMSGFCDNCLELRMNVGNAWEARKNSKNKEFLEAQRVFNGIQD